jgi:hypothetical protein
MINFIFSTHLRLSNGKRLSETARSKALCQWLFIRLFWSAHACLSLRSQQLNRKRPSVLSASGMNMLEHSSQARSIMYAFYKSVLLKQYLRGPPFALPKDRVRQTWMWWLPQYQWVGEWLRVQLRRLKRDHLCGLSAPPMRLFLQRSAAIFFCQHDIFVTYNYKYEDGKYAVSGSLWIIRNLMWVLQCGSSWSFLSNRKILTTRSRMHQD